MAQDGSGHVEAELPTEPRRRVVAELVLVPVRDLIAPDPLGLPVGPPDSVENRVIV